jgi:hypothetical protein
VTSNGLRANCERSEAGALSETPSDAGGTVSPSEQIEGGGSEALCRTRLTTGAGMVVDSGSEWPKTRDDAGGKTLDEGKTGSELDSESEGDGAWSVRMVGHECINSEQRGWGLVLLPTEKWTVPVLFGR